MSFKITIKTSLHIIIPMNIYRSTRIDSLLDWFGSVGRSADRSNAKSSVPHKSPTMRTTHVQAHTVNGPIDTTPNPKHRQRPEDSVLCIENYGMQSGLDGKAERPNRKLASQKNQRSAFAYRLRWISATFQLGTVSPASDATIHFTSHSTFIQC